MSASRPEVMIEVGLPEAVPSEAPEVTVLVERAKQGDPDAFAGLVRLNERRIIALGIHMGLSREDALDACQDTFVKVFRFIHRFHSGRPFRKWLYRIALNVVHDHARRNLRPGLVSIEEVGRSGETGLPAGGPSLHEALESADLAGKVLKGLGFLTRRERIVFVLRDLQEMPTEEIGMILRLSQVTVRRHCMSARQKLRDRLLPRGE